MKFSLQTCPDRSSPTSYSHVEGRLHDCGCSEGIKSGGKKKNLLSISHNHICLPARAFKTINKIRERTKAAVPLLPLSVSFSSFFFHPHSLLFCSSSFAGTMQTFSRFVCTSSPKGTSTLLMQTDSSVRTHERRHAEGQGNTQELIPKMNTFMLKGRYPPDMFAPTHTHTLFAFSLPALIKSKFKSNCIGIAQNHDLANC